MLGRNPRFALSGERRSALVVLSVPLLAATCVAGIGCTGTAAEEGAEEGLEPLEAPAADGPSGMRTPAGQDREPSGGGTTAAGSDGATATGEDAAVAAELTDLLARFDESISALYAEPLAAGDDGDPLSSAWLDVVVGGSQLDRQVRGRILASGTHDNTRIVPGDEGISFSNVALDMTARPDGSLEWVNCGYAPGIGVDLDTGEVRDDNRTSTRGRGVAVRAPDGDLVISELWDDESRLLAPGEPDPCIGLARSTSGDPRAGTAERDGDPG